MESNKYNRTWLYSLHVLMHKFQLKICFFDVSGLKAHESLIKSSFLCAPENRFAPYMLEPQSTWKTKRLELLQLPIIGYAFIYGLYILTEFTVLFFPGRVCVPINPKNCEEFDPSAAPTLSQVNNPRRVWL